MNQRARIRCLFLARPNREIPLTEILDMRISQYGRVIHELRQGVQDKEGNYLPGQEPMEIINNGEWINGVHHTWFKYVSAKDSQIEMF